MPVREALRRLEADRLVSDIPRRGAIVKPLDPDEAEELFFIRTLLEPAAAQLAAPKMQESELTKLHEIMAHLDDAARDHQERTFLELDREFHYTIYSVAGLPILLSMIRQLWDRSEVYRATAVYRSTSKRDLQTAQDEHRSILEACIQGDGLGAEQATRLNLQRSSADLVSALGKSAPGGLVDAGSVEEAMSIEDELDA